MEVSIILRLVLLVVVASATSMVKAFSPPASEVATTVGAVKLTSMQRSMRIKNVVPIVTGGSSSSLAAWGLSFGAPSKLPKVGKDGMYHISNEDEYRSLLEANPDKLIVLKVYSKWCKTCKAMAPKFEALARGIERNPRGGSTLPIVWATLPYSKDTNHFVRRTLAVKAVPSVQLYAGNGVLVDSFPCGPAKVTKILLPKLVDLITNHVDVSTGTLKPAAANQVASDLRKLHP